MEAGSDQRAKLEDELMVKIQPGEVATAGKTGSTADVTTPQSHRQGTPGYQASKSREQASRESKQEEGGAGELEGRVPTCQRLRRADRGR